MKADRSRIEKALDAPSSDIRLFFLYGPDEAGSAALVTRLEKAMGAQAERVDIDAATLKNDPARLADEAAAFSMFGDSRWIRIQGFGEEALAAIEALMSAEQAGNPVVALAGNLKSSSKLVKFALDHPAILAHISYTPEEREATQIATAIAREQGLRLSSELARRIVDLTGGDRALMAGEITKLALFHDAAPDRPADATAEALDALSAETPDADTGPIVNAVMGGDIAALQHELTMLDARGAALASIFRPLLARALLIATIRADFDASGRIEQAMDRAGKAIFWREKPAVIAQVRRWPASAVARAIERLAQGERATRNLAHSGDIIVRHELLAIARQAAKER